MSNDKDPWRHNPDGPPDLDEVMKGIHRKLRGALGGGSGGQYETQPTGSGIGFGLIALIAFVIWFLSGIFIVQPAEQAVITQFGAYKSTVGSGPHWIPRFIQSRDIVNVEELNTSQHGGLMLTEDENIVNVKIAVQYRIGSPEDYLFNVAEPHASLRQVADSALRYVIGHSTLDQILTSGRAVIAATVQAQMVENLDAYISGLVISDVAMQEAEAPEEVRSAFLDAIRAQEDEERLVNQAQAYARKIEPIARGDAERLLEDAKAYQQQVTLLASGDTERFKALLPEYERAPAVTRDRLYLGTMESVLSATSKVMVDLPAGNNFLYLPLDKLSTDMAPSHKEDDEVDTLAAQAQAVAQRALKESTTNRQDRPMTARMNRGGRA